MIIHALLAIGNVCNEVECVCCACDGFLLQTDTGELLFGIDFHVG